MTSRLLIRGPTARDRDAFLAAALRSRVFHRRWGAPPKTPQAFQAYLRRHQRSETYESHLLVERASGAIVGVANVMEIVRGSFEGAYLGYYLFRPHDAQGFMTEGLALVIDRAFGPLRLHRVEANIQPENARSIRLVERLGFRREGLARRYLKIGGRWRDHERWALLREEWPGAVRALRAAAGARSSRRRPS